jgi:cation diffusion facilitator CzcD-associated flavoprotein CzcO
VPSHVYSFSFALNPSWSRTYSHQPEIFAYIKDTAAKEGLLDHFVGDCEVEEAAWDAEAQRWRLRTSQGELSARVVIAGTGPLVAPKLPAVPGIDSFTGTVFHSARWDHDHDLRGERVAVIGTGASAIQFVPQIQPEVGELVLFQRTPPWVLPRTERPITDLEHRLFERVPGAQRAMRTAVYWGRESTVMPMLKHKLARGIKLLGLVHLRRSVKDKRLRKLLTPDYLPGCKRLLISNDYLPALDQPNVTVVPAGLKEVRGNVVVGADGTEREVDTIIAGTGFEVTEPPIAQVIRDRDGRTLAEHWNGSMTAHNGTTVAGFPNFFMLLGPNTGLGHMSVVFMAEAQARYVVHALDALDRAGAAAVEVKPEVQQAFNDRLQAKMDGTVWLEGGCGSWYLDATGRNTTLWPDFSCKFDLSLRTFDASQHVFEPQRAPVAAAA